MKPPTFIECSVCGREFGSKSIVIHEPQCLQKLRRTEILQQENNETAPGTNKKSRRKKKLVQRNKESESRGMGTTTATNGISTAAKSAAMPFEDDPSSSGGGNSSLSTSFVIMTTSATSSSVMRNTTEKLNLPKIQTSMKTSHHHHRPSTAILDKPRILNPEYIQYDMSLTRIDFTGQTSPNHSTIISSNSGSGGGNSINKSSGIDENQNRNHHQNRTLQRQNTQVLDNHHRTEFILPTVDGPSERDRLSQIHSTGANNMSKQSTKHHQRSNDASSNNSKLLPCTNNFTVDSILGDPGKKAGEDRGGGGGGGGGRMMMNIVGETIFPRESGQTQKENHHGVLSCNSNSTSNMCTIASNSTTTCCTSSATIICDNSTMSSSSCSPSFLTSKIPPLLYPEVHEWTHEEILLMTSFSKSFQNILHTIDPIVLPPIINLNNHNISNNNNNINNNNSSSNSSRELIPKCSLVSVNAIVNVNNPVVMNLSQITLSDPHPHPVPDPDSDPNLNLNTDSLIPLVLPPPPLYKAKSPPIESLFSAPNFHFSKLSQCDLEKPLPTCFHLEKIEKMPTPNRPNAAFDSNKNNNQPNLTSQQQHQQQQQYHCDKDDFVTPTTSATRTILCCHLPPPTPTPTPPVPATTAQNNTPPDNINSQSAHKNVNFSNYNYRYNESNSESEIPQLPKDQNETQTEGEDEGGDEGNEHEQHENKRESFKQALTAAVAALNTTQQQKSHRNHLGNTCEPITSDHASNQSEYGQFFNQLKEPIDSVQVQNGQENEQQQLQQQVSKEVVVLKNISGTREPYLKSQDGLAELTNNNSPSNQDVNTTSDQTQLPYQQTPPNWIGTPFMAHPNYYSVPQLQKGQKKSRILENGGDSECVTCGATSVSTEHPETDKTATKERPLSASTETWNSSSSSPTEGKYPSVISLIEELQEISNRKIVSRVKLCTNTSVSDHQNASYSRLLSSSRSSRTTRSRSRSKSKSRSRSRSQSISKCKCNVNKSNSNASLLQEKEPKKEKSDSHSSLSNHPTTCFPTEIITTNTTTTSKIQSRHTVKSRSVAGGNTVLGASDLENMEEDDDDDYVVHSVRDQKNMQDVETDGSLPDNSHEFSTRVQKKGTDYPDDSFEDFSTESASASQSDDPYSQNDESLFSTSRISSGSSWARNSSRRAKLYNEMKSTVSGSDADDEACDSPEIIRKIGRTFTNHDNCSSNSTRLRLSQRKKSSCTFSNTVIKGSNEMYTTKKKSSVNIISLSKSESGLDEEVETQEEQEDEERSKYKDEVLKFKVMAGMERGFPDDDNDFENLLSQKLIHVADHSRGLKKPKTKTNLKCGASKSINDLKKSPILHSYSLPSRTRAHPHISEQQQSQFGSPCDSNPSIFQECSELQINSNVRDSADSPFNSNNNDHHHLKSGMKSEQAFLEHSFHGENRMDRERIRERRPFLTHSRPTETEVEDTVAIWEGSHIIPRNRRPGENSMELLTNQESLPPRPQTRRHAQPAEDNQSSNLMTIHSDENENHENVNNTASVQGVNPESNNESMRRREDKNQNSGSKYMKILPLKVKSKSNNILKTHDNKRIQNLISNVCRLHEMQKDKKFIKRVLNNNNNERPKTSPACIEPILRDMNERVGSRGINGRNANANGKNYRPASAINRPSTCIPMSSQQSSKIGKNKDPSSKEKSKIPRSKRSMSKSATANNNHQQHHKNNFNREISGKKHIENNNNNNNNNSATGHANTKNYNKITQRPATANATTTFNYVQANANAFKNNNYNYHSNSFNFHPFISVSRPRTETVKTALIRKNSNLIHKNLSKLYPGDFHDTPTTTAAATTMTSIKSRPLAKSPGLSELQKYRDLQQQQEKRPKSPSPSIFSSYSTDEEPLELIYSFKSKAKSSQMKRKKSPIGLCTPLDMIKLDKASLYAQIELYRRRALAQRAEKKKKQPSVLMVKGRSKKFDINQNPNPLKKDKGTGTGNSLSSGSTPRSETPIPNSLKTLSSSVSKKRLLAAKKVLRELADKVRRDQEAQFLKQLQEQKIHQSTSPPDKSYSYQKSLPINLKLVQRVKSPLKLRVKTKKIKLPNQIERKTKKTEIPVPMSKRVQFSSPVHETNNNNNNISINSTVRNPSNQSSTPIPISIRNKVIRKQKVPPEKQSQSSSQTGNGNQRKRSSTSTSTQVDRGSGTHRKSHSAGLEKQSQKLRITIQAAKDKQGKLKLTLKGERGRGCESDHDDKNDSPEPEPTPRRTMTAPPIPNITLAELEKEGPSACQGPSSCGNPARAREAQQNQEKRDQEVHRKKELRDTLERLEQNRDRLRGKDFEKRKREGGGGGGKKDDHTSVASMAIPVQQKDGGEEDKMLNVKIIVRRKDPDGSLPAIENVVHAFSTKWSYLIVDEQPLTSTSPNPFIASHQSKPKTKKQDENFYALKITTSNQSTIDSLPSEEALNRFLTCYICGKTFNAKEFHDHEKECVTEVNRKNNLIQDEEDKIILPPKPQGTITIKHWNDFAYEVLKGKYVKCRYCGLEYFPEKEGESERHKNQCLAKKSTNSKQVGVRTGGTYGPVSIQMAEDSMGWVIPTIRDLRRGNFHCAAQRQEMWSGVRYKPYRKPKTGSQSIS